MTSEWLHGPIDRIWVRGRVVHAMHFDAFRARCIFRRIGSLLVVALSLATHLLSMVSTLMLPNSPQPGGGGGGCTKGPILQAKVLLERHLQGGYPMLDPTRLGAAWKKLGGGGGNHGEFRVSQTLLLERHLQGLT